ncbi:putative orfan [Tupanvirus soda lake]|uniref:Orfan n=2 Tax=Tupanvirus TaxID=2094720 RepID=A0AC62AAA6_9VIRU|nr:putative orfan [Tupanvirus soda lake]QKU34705.1 putative orfan [Tupanvirus soda lake]
MQHNNNFVCHKCGLFIRSGVKGSDYHVLRFNYCDRCVNPQKYVKSRNRIFNSTSCQDVRTTPVPVNGRVYMDDMENEIMSKPKKSYWAKLGSFPFRNKRKTLPLPY